MITPADFLALKLADKKIPVIKEFIGGLNALAPQAYKIYLLPGYDDIELLLQLDEYYLGYNMELLTANDITFSQWEELQDGYAILQYPLED